MPSGNNAAMELLEYSAITATEKNLIIFLTSGTNNHPAKILSAH
jgi:hypothetical protein